MTVDIKLDSDSFSYIRDACNEQVIYWQGLGIKNSSLRPDYAKHCFFEADRYFQLFKFFLDLFTQYRRR